MRDLPRACRVGKYISIVLAALSVLALPFAPSASGQSNKGAAARAQATALFARALAVTDLRAPGSPPFELRGTIIGNTVYASSISPTEPLRSRPIVVLEGINTIHGIGGHNDVQMLVRLTDDGKVQWGEWAGKTLQSQTSSLSAERMSEVKRSLDAIDQSGLHPNMGPYYVYIDTEVELRIRMATPRGELTFSVLNPWWSTLTHKPMPKNVKAVVCEISRLSAQLAKEPVDHQCETSHASR